MSRPRRAHRDPGHRQLLAACAPRAHRARPRTGTPVSLPARYAAWFKPGRKLRKRVERDSRAPAEAQPPAAESEDPQPHCDRSSESGDRHAHRGIASWPLATTGARRRPGHADRGLAASPGSSEDEPAADGAARAVVRVRGPSRLAGVPRDLSVFRTRCSPCRRPARGRIAHPATQRPNGPSSPPAAHAGTAVMVFGRGARETAAGEEVSTLPEHARPPEPDPAPNPRRHRREHAQRSRRTRASVATTPRERRRGPRRSQSDARAGDGRAHSCSASRPGGWATVSDSRREARCHSCRPGRWHVEGRCVPQLWRQAYYVDRDAGPDRYGSNFRRQFAMTSRVGGSPVPAESTLTTLPPDSLALREETRNLRPPGRCATDRGGQPPSSAQASSLPNSSRT